MNLFENNKASGKPIKIFLKTSSTNNITNNPEEKNINKENSNNYGRCTALDRVIKGKRYKNNNWECKIDDI